MNNNNVPFYNFADMSFPSVASTSQFPSQAVRPVINTANLQTDPFGRPRSAITRRSPAHLQPSRKRYNSISSLQTIPSASLVQNSMSYQWQPQGYSTPYNYAQVEDGNEKQQQLFPPPPGGLDLLGISTGYNFSQTPNILPNTSNYRPSLALDTTGPTFLTPQQQQQLSAYSSNPPSGLVADVASSHDGDIITPGLPINYNSYQPYAPIAAPDQLQSQPQDNFQQFPFYGLPQQYSNGEMQQQGTISPSQLGQHSALKPTKSFGDLLMGSRGSSSSSESTEDTHDWRLNSLDGWTKPMVQALLPESTHVDRATVPEPSRKPVINGMLPPTSYTVAAPPPATLDTTIQQYMHSPNRLAFGERKIVVMSPKVGQKSYGNEKRFLCPHPQAALIGGAWWVKSPDGCPVSPMQPPRVNISLTGEQPVKDATVNWTAVDGQSLDERTNTHALSADDKPFIGNVAGKNLHISDNDGKRREVKAVVTIKAPHKHHAGPHGWGLNKGTLQDITSEDIIGVFESKEIKVISKPSKKKSNAKSGELKSQTTSTRYLSVEPDFTRILGSDGRPVIGAKVPSFDPQQTAFPGFTANANVWESFIIWLVDPHKQGGPSTTSPPHPDWPSPPANVIAPNLLAPPIRYNSTIVLQSLQTGLISPTLVIRRIESDADAVGMDGHVSESPSALPAGEFAGDLVSQLQKVAFELYRPDTMEQLQRDSRWGGSWLACSQEAVSDHFVPADRRWAPLPVPLRGSSRPSSVPTTPQQRFGVLPMTPHTTAMGLPSTPSSPVSSSSSLDYFGAHSRKSSSSAIMSPLGSGEIPLPTSDGGPIRRHRTGSIGMNPMARPAMSKKRMSAESTSSFELMTSALGMTASPPESQRAFWTMDVGDSCIWSIVSTEQTTYTFYVPPYASESAEPFAPFPHAQRLLPPNMSADQGPAKYAHPYTTTATMPLITLYGKNFVKRPDGLAEHLVYYGSTPASYNEVRCSEVMAASEPQPLPRTKEPVFLVRADGQCIVPTGLTYP